MYEQQKKISNILFYILFALDILLLGFLFTKPHLNISFQKDPLYTLNKDWIYTKHDGSTMLVDLPASLEAGNDDSVSISHTIPKNKSMISHLCILSSHQNLEAYIDDELIYSRVNPSSNGFFDLPTGGIWDIVELPNDSAGKTITLIISSDYNNYVGKVSEVYAGTRTGLLLHILESSSLSLVLSVMTLLLGLVLLIVYLFIKRLLNINKAMLHLSWFTVLCSTWMLAESDLTQLFISNEYVISGILYLSLITFPLPLILYITDIDRFYYKNLMYKVGYAFSVAAFLFILLQFFNVFDLLQSVTIVRYAIFLLLTLVLVLLSMDLFKNKNLELKSYTIATTILLVFEGIELLTYQSRSSNNGIVFQIGFLIFIAMLMGDALKNIAGVIKLSESAKHYKFLATRDLLTNCRNRIAYARDLELLQPDYKTTIYIADLNDLKLINDNYGHIVGDEILVLSSQCLLNTFGRSVYRIGGDEFVSIQPALTPEKREQLIRNFEIDCKKANLDSPHPFSVSIGYAVYDQNLDTTIYDTINRADKDMYEKKEQMKKSISL